MIVIMVMLGMLLGAMKTGSWELFAGYCICYICFVATDMLMNYFALQGEIDDNNDKE